MATILGAPGIGIESEAGSLEAGNLAVLVVLDADSLNDIRNPTPVRMVMKNGRLYDAADLTEVWPRRRALDFRGFVDDPPARTGVSGGG